MRLRTSLAAVAAAALYAAPALGPDARPDHRQRPDRRAGVQHDARDHDADPGARPGLERARALLRLQHLRPGRRPRGRQSRALRAHDPGGREPARRRDPRRAAPARRQLRAPRVGRGADATSCAWVRTAAASAGTSTAPTASRCSIPTATRRPPRRRRTPPRASEGRVQAQARPGAQAHEPQDRRPRRLAGTGQRHPRGHHHAGGRTTQMVLRITTGQLAGPTGLHARAGAQAVGCHAALAAPRCCPIGSSPARPRRRRPRRAQRGCAWTRSRSGTRPAGS